MRSFCFDLYAQWLEFLEGRKGSCEWENLQNKKKEKEKERKKKEKSFCYFNVLSRNTTFFTVIAFWGNIFLAYHSAALCLQELLWRQNYTWANGEYVTIKIRLLSNAHIIVC